MPLGSIVAIRFMANHLTEIRSTATMSERTVRTMDINRSHASTAPFSFDATQLADRNVPLPQNWLTGT